MLSRFTPAPSAAAALASAKPVALALIFAFYGASAFAHAALESASPPAGDVVAPPAEIRLTFSKAVEPKFSTIVLSGPGGLVPFGKPRGEAKAIVVKVGKTLAPGAYAVKWKAVSLDTHRTQGDFSFTVK